MSLLTDNIKEHIALFTGLTSLDGDVQRAGAMLADALARGNKIMFCGNGGSAADSQHIAAELTGRFVADRRPLAAMALSTDTSALTCIANDYSFDDVFLRQVQGLGRPGDCLVGISTSGNSENVRRALEYARSNDIVTVGLLGRDGGKILALCDIAITIPSWTTARIQEAHILVGHTLCGMVEERLELIGG